MHASGLRSGVQKPVLQEGIVQVIEAFLQCCGAGFRVANMKYQTRQVIFTN